MGKRTADILLHPVRLRIVLAISIDEVTTSDLAERLPDIPQASLYRHVAILAAAGIIQVVGERPVRGAVERTYRLNREAATVGPEEASTMSADEHLEAFTVFTGALIDAFGRYLADPEADPATDGVGYHQVAMWLDDDQFSELVEEMGDLLGRYGGHGASPRRRRRLLTTIVMPDATTR